MAHTQLFKFLFIYLNIERLEPWYNGPKHEDRFTRFSSNHSFHNILLNFNKKTPTLKKIPSYFNKANILTTQ